MSGSSSTADNTYRPEKVAEESYYELNSLFYAAQPAQTLRANWRRLLKACSSEEMEPGQIQVGMLHIKVDESTKELLHQVGVDAIVHLHHAAETLFRLMWAHVDDPRCPWMGVANLRHFGEVKNRLKKWNEGVPQGVDLEQLFMGASPTGLDPEAWQRTLSESLPAYELLLCRLANLLLVEADLYNAAKHGMVGIPLDLGSVEFEGVRMLEGPGFVNLCRDADKPKTVAEVERWHLFARTLDLERRFAIAGVVHVAIENLMNVGRWRRLGGSARICPPTVGLVEAAWRCGKDSEASRWRGLRYQVPAKEAGHGWEKGLAPMRMEFRGAVVTEDASKRADSWIKGQQAVQEIVLDERRGDCRQLSPGRHLLPFSPANW